MQSRNKLQYKMVESLIPSLGNIIFTVLMIAITLWAQSAGAITLGAMTATNSTVTIPYQGSLIDDSGTPISGQQIMAFNLYNQPTGGVPLWTENRLGTNSVSVNSGLFNVMLGSVTSLNQSVITENDILYLGVTIGTSAEMMPRIQLGAVPYAVQALTVPDGSITTEKLDLTGLDVAGDMTVNGDIQLDGTINGPTSHWADYRPYLRFLKENGASESAMCPEGGEPVGVVSPSQSLSIKTGNDLASIRYGGAGTCVNVHHMAPCGTINGDFFPYHAQSCTTNFSGKWAPFYWWDGTPTHSEVSTKLLGKGIGCFPVKYACVK